MKPKIARTWCVRAEHIEWSVKDTWILEANVRYWTKRLAYVKWLMKMNAAKYLVEFNRTKANLIVATMALELRLKRYRLYPVRYIETRKAA